MAPAFLYGHLLGQPVAQRAHRRHRDQLAFQIGDGLDRRTFQHDRRDVARRAGESGDADPRRALGDEGQPRSAAEPDIDAAGGQRLLHLGVAAEIGAVDIETKLSEEALRDADIDRQKSPGGALRLADTDLLVGARGLRAAEGGGRDQHHAAVARCALRSLMNILCDLVRRNAGVGG